MAAPTPTPQFNMLVEPSGGAYRNNGYGNGYSNEMGTQHLLSKVSDGFASAAQDSHALSGQIGASTASTSAAIERATIAGRDSTERMGLSVLSATERNGSDTRISVERTAANGMATTERNGGETRASVYQNTQGVLSSSERNGGETRTAVFQNGQGILSSVERNGADTRASVYQGNQAVLSSSERNGGDTRTALYQQSQGLSSAIERNGGETRTSVYQNGQGVLNAVQLGNGQLSSAVERNGGDTRTSVYQNGQGVLNAVQLGNGQVASAVERNGGDSRTAISQAQGHLAAATERNGGETRASVLDARSQIELALGDTRTLLRSDIMQTLNAVDRTAAAVAVQVAAGTTANQLSAKDILIQQLQVKGDLLQFNGTGFGQARTDLFQVKSDLAMQLKEAELEALKTEQRLSKQMAECCCEIKEKIDMNSCAIKEKIDTRATITDVLIKDTEASRLKDELYYSREKYLIRSHHHHRDRSYSPRRGRDGRDGRDARRSPSPGPRRN